MLGAAVTNGTFVRRSRRLSNKTAAALACTFCCGRTNRGLGPGNRSIGSLTSLALSASFFHSTSPFIRVWLTTRCFFLSMAVTSTVAIAHGLNDALQSFQSILTDDQRRQLRDIKSVPDADAVLIFTAELDAQTAKRKGAASPAGYTPFCNVRGNSRPYWTLTSSLTPRSLPWYGGALS